MASTTKIHKDFLATPMHDKPVTAIPGIGAVAAKNLKKHNITKATEVFAKFMEVSRENGPFCDWLMEKSGAQVNRRNECYQALCDYYKQFMM